MKKDVAGKFILSSLALITGIGLVLFSAVLLHLLHKVWVILLVGLIGLILVGAVIKLAGREHTKAFHSKQ